MAFRLRSGFQLVHYRSSKASALCGWLDKNSVNLLVNDGAGAYYFSSSLHDENIALFGPFKYPPRRVEIFEELDGPGRVHPGITYIDGVVNELGD